MKENREKLLNKWSKNYMNNILENQMFKQNNVGLSHLTSPMNYTSNEMIQNLALKRKEFLLKNIDDYESKLNPKKSSTRP